MASIAYTSESGRLEVIEFDVLEQYGVTHTAKATQFPVETGAVITDHVLQDSDVVRFTGLVSDTPLPSDVGMSLEAIGTNMAETFKGRAALVYAGLVRVKEAGRLVTIDTPLRFFEDMVLEGVETGEAADAGAALSFNLSARQIRTTSTKTVAAPTIEAAKPKVSKGRQPTKKVEGRPKSTAKAARDTVSAWMK